MSGHHRTRWPAHKWGAPVNTIHRVGQSAAVALVVMMTATGSVVFACVPQPMLLVQPRASGQVGSQVNVEGMNFQGLVEVRWNGLDGPLLGSASEGNFSVVVTVPDAPAGLYALVALERQQDGSAGGLARTSFQVVTQGGSAPDPAVAAARLADAPSTVSVSAIALALAAGVTLVLVGIALGSARARHRSDPTH